MNTTNLKSQGPSRIYHRSAMSKLKPTEDRSLIYSRSQARRTFERYPNVQTFEYVSDGCKTSSQILNRGDKVAPVGCYVLVSSTGGKWGRSSRWFEPKA